MEVIKERDEVYYFETVVFEVENTIFRVPKKGFDVPGTPFEAMFTLPVTADSAIVEGSSDSKPIRLDGIPKSDFRGFLRVLYPFSRVTPAYEDWLYALGLATMWQFDAIRKEVVDALTLLLKVRSPEEEIILGKKYGVKSWLYSGYTKLVVRDQPLDVDALRLANIDSVTIVRLLSVREHIYQFMVARSANRRSAGPIDLSTPSWTANMLASSDPVSALRPRIDMSVRQARVSLFTGPAATDYESVAAAHSRMFIDKVFRSELDLLPNNL